MAHDELEIGIPFLSPARLYDQKVREENILLYGEDALCKRCDGTGNELFYHFKECRACGGAGVIE